MSAAPRASGARHTYRNFVGGAWVPSESAKTVPNLNPADEHDVLGEVPLSTAAEMGGAVAAAQAAFPAWRDTPAPIRGAILYKAMAILESEQEDVARLLTREEGKTLKESVGEVQRSVNILEYIAGAGRRL